MKTQQFIKEHTFSKITKIVDLNGKVVTGHMMHHEDAQVFFNGGAQILYYSGIKPTPQEINTIENLIITYLDDLYLSEFEEIKSMM